MLEDVFHWTAKVINEPFRGPSTPADEVLLTAHPKNKGTVWVRTKKQATAENAIPLLKTDVTGFKVKDLSDLSVMIEEPGDTLIVAWALREGR